MLAARPGHLTTGGASIWFRIVLVFAMAMPMLVLYAISTLGTFIVRDLHLEAKLLGYLVMSSFGIAAILSPWGGALVDRIGPRDALTILFFTVALAFTLLATGKDYFYLVAATAICGIAQALANPVTNLLIAQQVPAEKKAAVAGLKQSGVQLAALFAGLALPAVATHYGWPSAFGIVVPVAILLGITSPYVAPTRGKSLRAGKIFSITLPNKLLLQLMSVQFCVGISLSAFVTFLPTFAAQNGMPLAVAGSLIAVFGVMGMFSRIALTPLGAKLKEEALLLLTLIAIAACAIGVTMQAGPESHWCLWIGAIGVGLTAVGTNAIAMSMLIRDDRFGIVTTTSGFVSLAFFGGFSVGPPLYATFSDYSGSFQAGWIFLIGVLLCGCGLALMLAFARQRQALVPVGPRSTIK
ncbi:Cyanate permease [Nitrosospira multiformis]|uniref:Cyanate permease n=1 Tax=Nitrosospira multiformis TaxID=1231 RepID=A0A1H8MZ04_9PROT|nr:MFS transporter [Nitrosospira multiformis]SEO22542.1 Cyanate permease [Nitrosospira multiformis]